MTALLSGLVALDEQMRTDHCFLDAADCCLCLADYLPGRSTAANRINRLIANLKCPPSIATTDPRRGRYKQQAIGEVARALRAGGYLFLGHAESLFGLTDLFEPVVQPESIVYRLRGSAAGGGRP